MNPAGNATYRSETVSAVLALLPGAEPSLGACATCPSAVWMVSKGRGHPLREGKLTLEAMEYDPWRLTAWCRVFHREQVVFEPGKNGLAAREGAVVGLCDAKEEELRAWADAQAEEEVP